MIGNLGRFIEEQIENLMSSLLARTDTYLGSLQQRFNITNVIDSITFVKENTQSKLEESKRFFQTSSAKKISSDIQCKKKMFSELYRKIFSQAKRFFFSLRC